MALTTYYYQWTGSPDLQTQIRKVADATATLGVVTFPVAIDVTVDSTNKDALDLVMNTAGFVEVAAALDASWGKLISVDSVLGDNAKGRRGGYPFATITAALAVALDGDFVLVGPGTYIEQAGITIPIGVALVGRSSGVCTIQATAVAVATDLVTLGTRSKLEHFTLILSSANHVQLRALVYPGTTTETANVGKIFITVDQTGASAAGTSNAFGVAITGNGVPPVTYECLAWNCDIVVKGAGNGRKRGVVIDTAAFARIARCSILMIQTNVPATPNYCGAESNNAGAILTLKFGAIDGGTGAGHSDISQTLGMIQVGAENLHNSNANGLGFVSVIQTGLVIWGDPGNLAAGTNFMRFGTSPTTNAEAKVRLVRKCVAHALSVKVIAAPGGTDVFTIRKNGVDTALVASLVGPATSVTVDNISVSFADGDDISLKVVRGAAGASDVQVSVNLY